MTHFAFLIVPFYLFQWSRTIKIRIIRLIPNFTDDINETLWCVTFAFHFHRSRIISSVTIKLCYWYISFQFTKWRVIANPIYDFMWNTWLMVSDTVELWNLYSQTTRRENKKKHFLCQPLETRVCVRTFSRQQRITLQHDANQTFVQSRSSHDFIGFDAYICEKENSEWFAHVVVIIIQNFAGSAR